MAAKTLIDEAIALTEKKVDMSLDEIIKMSKTNPVKPKKQRVSNRSQKFVTNAAQDRSVKAQSFMDTRSFLRQGVLARKRSNYQGNQFPASYESARKAVVAPVRNRNFSRSRTFSVNKPRAGALTVPKVAANGSSSFTVKKTVEQENIVVKQKPQTLDSRFANMKKQRMRDWQENNGARRNGGGQPRLPWARNQY